MRNRKKPRQKLPTGGPTEHAIKEVKLAYDRINGSAAHRLQWLLMLSELDWDGLSEGRKADLRWEVVAFGLNENPVTPGVKLEDVNALVMPPEKITAELSLDPNLSLTQIMEEPLAKGAHPETIKSFQRFLRLGFQTLFTGEWWTYESPETRKSIAVPHLVGINKADASLSSGRAAKEILEQRAFELIDLEKKRLTICENPRCRKRFISAKEGRSRFHSPGCSAYVRIAKSRGKEIYPEGIPADGIQKFLAKMK